MDSTGLPPTLPIFSPQVSSANSTIGLIEEVFFKISTLNTENILCYLTDDIEYKFGAKAIGSGKKNMAMQLDEMFSCLQSSNYDFLLITAFNSSVTVETEGVFILKNGKTLHLSGVVVIKMKENQIKLFKMYMDLEPVFASVQA